MGTLMQIDKPKLKRVYVTAVDAEGQLKSVSTTIYGCEPQQVIDRLKESITAGTTVSDEKPKRERRRQSA